MKELIDPHQAHLLMLAVLVLAPIIGAGWGLVTRRVPRGLALGLAVGVGNYALWTVYNAITDRLGLDTTKNLLVNLCLFILLGVALGLGVGWYAGKHRAHGGPDGDVAGDR